jgi:hypothetical protein
MKVQEIYPKARLEKNDVGSKNIIIDDWLCVAHYDDRFKLVSSGRACEYCVQDSIVCDSKDFSKILAVLKAIKECER